MIRAFILALMITTVATAGEDHHWFDQYDPQDHISQSFADGFDATGYRILGTAVVASLLARNHDEIVRDKYRGDQVFSRDVSTFGAYWGSGVPGILLASTQLYFDTENGIAHAESLALTSASHLSLVLLTRRSRPGNPKEWNSFPSGHSSSAWATATSLSYAYGWKIGIPAYTAAIATMAGRINDDRHWLSDTVAAAFLGFFWGRATHFHHQTSSTDITFHPVVVEDKVGLGLQYDF
ncbi:MAG: phosphatase PAP2 family protein [Oligoflexus sp.]